MAIPPLVQVPTRLVTRRLILRAPVPSDAPELNALIRSSLPELKPWMIWAQTPPPLAETRAFIRARLADFRARTHFMMLLVSRRSGHIVGSMAILRIDWAVPKMEIGYWCATRSTGHGYITEAAGALTHLAFETLGAARVEIVCDARNTGSRAVAERLGYRLDGILKNERRSPDGQLTDSCLYAVTSARDPREKSSSRTA